MWLDITVKLACAALIAVTALVSQTCYADMDGERIAMIDSYALSAPRSEEATPGTLVRYLSQPTRNDTEKARAIFRWVTDRISYDVDAYFSNNLVAMNADDVLRQRRSICDGYATLFEHLAHEAGMEAVTIKGYAKAYGHAPGARFDRPNHTWNAIKIDGQWRLVDTTWGAGYVRNGRYVKALTETFFLAPPEQLMFTHFPLNEAWQLQSTPHLSKAQFEALPEMEPAFFQLGILGDDVWRAMNSSDFSGSFVRTYDLPYHLAVVQHAPLSYRLHTDQALQFSIRSESFEQMAIVQNNKWTTMSKRDAAFTLNYVARDSGDLLVVGKKPGAQDFTAILGYQITQ
jgi:hypothetical protein